jgi:DNA-binding beta-propeller fold protein YncE
MRKLAFFLSLILVLTPITVFAEETAVEQVVSTVAGSGSHGSSDGTSLAQFNLPLGITGNGKSLFVTDTYNNLIREIDRFGVTDHLAGRIIGLDDNGFPSGLHLDGFLTKAMFNRPAGIVADGNYKLYIADAGNNAIRLINSNRVITVAGNSYGGYGNGTAEQARFTSPSGIAMDSRKNLYVADTLNHCIRKIDPKGNVTTVAGTPMEAGFSDGRSDAALFNCPIGIAVSEDGRNIYVADTGNHRIRLIRSGRVTTYAGTTEQTDEYGEPVGGFLDGVGKDAMFNLPMGLVLNGEDLIVADSANHRIRLITSDGVTTLAGSGEPGAADGSFLAAEFNLPSGVFLQNGTLYIADTGNNLIRSLPLEQTKG